MALYLGAKFLQLEDESFQLDLVKMGCRRRCVEMPSVEIELFDVHGAVNAF